MKHITNIIFAILCLVSTDAFPRDLKLPRFKAGDVVSADVFNDILEQIEKSQATPTDTDLDGDWACTAVSAIDYYYDINDSYDGWVSSPSGITFTTAGTLTFSNGNISSDVFLFHPQLPTYWHFRDLNTPYDLIDGTVYFAITNINRGAGGHSTAIYNVKMSGDNHIDLIPAIGGGDMVDRSYIPVPAKVNCDRVAAAPLPPTDLTVTVSKKGASITWSSSEGADDYNVYRKESTDETFKKVESITGTSYEDAPGNGTWLYKIKSENEHGESDSGGVVKAKIEE